MSANRDALVERVAEALARHRFTVPMLSARERHQAAAAVLDALPELAQAQAAVERGTALADHLEKTAEGLHGLSAGTRLLIAQRLRAALAGPEPTDPEQEV